VSRLILYTTAGCHLCEQAEELLQQLQQHHSITVQAVDISSDEELVELYGVRIPVVKNSDNNRELGWPFGLDELVRIV
jgi:glutaredoxin